MAPVKKQPELPGKNLGDSMSLPVSQASRELRPKVIAAIAHWWQQSLSAADQEGNALVGDLTEVAARFNCSKEEAVRGLAVGEYLHWGASQ